GKAARPIGKSRYTANTTEQMLKRMAPNGKPARTFKHFVMSPDPQDGLTADQVAELASAWALRHFADFEAAIVLHDDTERKIPHAHIVDNNTNLAT
ncbi:relaxase/mobilization nuclease domain-containing protein, partial [Adlercreutzia sp. DFI.6.23]|uniref:relaxase/mobilization nuclease domain-containing protein n=1 Tax=Adlercreutzia sp. DFI.6.23 TaxID=2963705 RepID=UPI00210CEDD8